MDDEQKLAKLREMPQQQALMVVAMSEIDRMQSKYQYLKDLMSYSTSNSNYQKGGS